MPSRDPVEALLQAREDGRGIGDWRRANAIQDALRDVLKAARGVARHPDDQLTVDLAFELRDRLQTLRKVVRDG